MASVTCPSCASEAPEGAAFCPSCDAVLDPSAFEDGGAAPGPTPAPAKAEPPKKVADPRRAARAPAPVEAAPAPRRRKRAKKEIDFSPDRVLADTWSSFQTLMPFDRLALGGLVAVAVSMLLPWRFTQVDGEEIGVFAGGWMILILMALASAALWLRTSDDLRGVRPDHLAGLQLVTALGSVGLSAYLFFASLDPHPYKSVLGTTNLWSSYPEFGVGICALAAIVVGYASVWAYWVERANLGYG